MLRSSLIKKRTEAVKPGLCLLRNRLQQVSFEENRFAFILRWSIKVCDEGSIVSVVTRRQTADVYIFENMA